MKFLFWKTFFHCLWLFIFSFFYTVICFCFILSYGSDWIMLLLLVYRSKIHSTQQQKRITLFFCFHFKILTNKQTNKQTSNIIQRCPGTRKKIHCTFFFPLKKHKTKWIFFFVFSFVCFSGISFSLRMFVCVCVCV